MKALVVGGTGFLGMNVVRALLAAGHDVVATRRAQANTLFARKLGAKLVVAELDDEEGLMEVMRGREVVFMCAGHYPRFSLDLAGEVAVARRRAAAAAHAALRAGVSRYVLTSSVATVGPPSTSRTLSCETDPMAPSSLRSVYYAVKDAIEQETRRVGAEGLDVVTLCPTGVFGELDVKAGTGYLLVGLARGALRLYVNGRTNVIDAIGVGEAHVKAAERGRRGARYLVAGHNTTIETMLREAAHLLEVDFRARKVPTFAAGLLATFQEWRCARSTPVGRPLLPREFVDMARFGQWVDPEPSRSALGLAPPPALQEILRTAIAWYIRFRYIDAKPAWYRPAGGGEVRAEGLGRPADTARPGSSPGPNGRKELR